MKKNILFPAMLVLCAIIGQAQTSIDMNLVKKMLHPQQARSLRDDIAPSRVIYHTNEDAIIEYSDVYLYDEFEYYLAEIQTSYKDLDSWLPYSNTTYEYDYNLMPVKITTKIWDNGYVNDKSTTITYNGDDFDPLIQEELFQKWDNGSWVNLYKNIYSYEPEQTILVKDWNGSGFENHYLYIIENDATTTTILLQFWKDGAWQNQEKQTITYDHGLNIQERVFQQWDNPNWINAERDLYEYEAPFKLTKVTKTLWDNNTWSPDKVQTIHYTHQGYNSTHAICEANYGNAETLNTDIEMFYNQGQCVTYKHVNEVFVDYVDVTKLQEHPSFSQFIIAPNPIQDQLRIQGHSFMKAELYTMTGQKVLESVSPVITINGVSSGAYLLKIQDLEGRVETQKVLVQ